MPALIRLTASHFVILKAVGLHLGKNQPNKETNCKEEGWGFKAQVPSCLELLLSLMNSVLI